MQACWSFVKSAFQTLFQAELVALKRLRKNNIELKREVFVEMKQVYFLLISALKKRQSLYRLRVLFGGREQRGPLGEWGGVKLIRIQACSKF